MSLESVVEFLQKVHEKEQAKSLLDTFSKYAKTYEEWDQLGKLYCDIRDYPSSEKWTKKCLVTASSNEKMYACRANLAKVYNHLNLPEQSIFYSNLNRQYAPDDPDVLLESSMAYFLMNEKEKSEAILREMDERDDLSEQHMNIVKFNLGTYDLFKGKFIEGLHGFMVSGKKLNIWFDASALPFKWWEGGIQPGKTIAIFAEGGIGDEIINIRFMQHFKDVGMNPIWLSSRKDVSDMFVRNGFKSTVNISDIPKDALWTYSMHSPIYLNTKPEDLWTGPYLTPDSELVKNWSSKFTDNKKVKVGIRWTGNPQHELDLHRQIPLAKIVEQFDLEKFDLYSLQKGPGEEQLVDYPFIHHFMDEVTTFDDTLAIIDNLDLVVTSCTSIVHGAAAMGKKTLLFTPLTAYYTWSHPGNKSPWYGENLIQMRQVTPRNWDAQLSILKEELSKYD